MRIVSAMLRGELTLGSALYRELEEPEPLVFQTPQSDSENGAAQGVDSEESSVLMNKSPRPNIERTVMNLVFASLLSDAKTWLRSIS